MGDFRAERETRKEKRCRREENSGSVFFVMLIFGSHVQMTFDRFKAFLADDMLDAAGIFRGGLLINTKAHQAAGEELVALIDHLCDRASAVGQVDVAFRRYADLLFFS